MSEITLKYSSSHELESYLLLAKSAKGAACAQLIKELLAAPNTFVFSEVLRMPNVTELKNQPEYASYFSLLELFSYGTYQDYKERASSLPELTQPQIRKLKSLSIVTLASEKHVLEYSNLLHYLDISNVRELEDLMIDAMYKGLIKAKLDQKKSQVEIEYTIGRDLRPGQLDQMLKRLNSWSSTSLNILNTIDEKIEQIKETSNNALQAREEHEKKVEHITSELQNSNGKHKSNERFESRMTIHQFKDGSEISSDRMSKRPLISGRR
ncbi:hypothetical protein K7432_002946 [Basidiobolus ranarum]|uniref:PCI domain-containing protein n=1 Tax=Basidiobolus ranarum TaxID=34480 RepID=A0ABR2W724_9FUNG